MIAHRAYISTHNTQYHGNVKKKKCLLRRRSFDSGRTTSMCNVIHVFKYLSFSPHITLLFFFLLFHIVKFQHYFSHEFN